MRAASVWLLLVFLASCGVKGPPKPPLDEMAQPVPVPGVFEPLDGGRP